MTEASIWDAMAETPTITVADPDALDVRLREAAAPFVVRGLVADWPLVAAARHSDREARAYLLSLHRDVPFTVATGAPGSDGRMFYDQAMGMNFRTDRAKLSQIFERMNAEEGEADASPLYLAGVDVHDFFRGLHEANHVPLAGRDCLASIWIGTRTRVAAHNDFPDNLACVAAGRRRFTLFPPEQFSNLYLGPIDNTPGGRAVSLVDFHAPDFERFPRFREALRHAQYVELAAGDALHIPTMWWHHVEALDPFNVLVNYWWRDTPRWMGQPQNALNLALLTIRDLPEAEKRHWRALFDHYVFDNDAQVTAHIPQGGRGVLDPLTAESAGRLHAFLLRQLNR
jgi:hypothetical protein